uniref:Uncharacterized protein n=1 Tax=Romanomermis culicivorax TaxID=13658 RepID=A0A915HSZ6_ROMCU
MYFDCGSGRGDGELPQENDLMTAWIIKEYTLYTIKEDILSQEQKWHNGFRWTTLFGINDDGEEPGTMCTLL